MIDLQTEILFRLARISVIILFAGIPIYPLELRRANQALFTQLRRNPDLAWASKVDADGNNIKRLGMNLRDSTVSQTAL